jgi:hypothetical protein
MTACARIRSHTDEGRRTDHNKFKEASMSEKKSDPGKCSDWKAWIDAMPPGRRLHVQGKCVYPTAGWTITLKKRVPQGAVSSVLMLDRVADPPRDPAVQKETTYTPTYEQKLGPDENYDTVTIMPEEISVQVSVAH